MIVGRLIAALTVPDKLYDAYIYGPELTNDRTVERLSCPRYEIVRTGSFPTP